MTYSRARNTATGFELGACGSRCVVHRIVVPARSPAPAGRALFLKHTPPPPPLGFIWL